MQKHIGWFWIAGFFGLLAAANAQISSPPTVSLQGDLVMRRASEAVPFGESPGLEAMIVGRIEGNGTIRARHITWYCNYDLIWQKQPQ